MIDHPYNSKKLYSKIVKLLEQYRHLGYSLADLEKDKFDRDKGILDLYFDEGKVSEIVITGNKYTHRNVILREFPLDKGAYFSYAEASDGLTNLRITNLFDDIYLTIKREGSKNILIIHVLEKMSSLVRFGFRAF